MTSREAAVYQLKNLKGKPLKEKIIHIATYYWIPIVAVAAGLAVVIGMAVNIATSKETILQGYMINAAENQEQVQLLEASLAEHLGMTEKEQITLLANLSTSANNLGSTMQLLAMHATAREIDFLAGDKAGCEQMLYSGYYGALDTMLTPQQLEALSEYILYCEASTLEEQDLFSTEDLPRPQLSAPDGLQEPVPVALRLPEDNALAKAYTFSENTVYLLLMPNSQRTEALWQFLEYLLPEAP